MAGNVKMKLDGMRELRAALDKMPKELARTVEMSALREAMKPVSTAAKANAARYADTGLLASSIGLNVRKKKGQSGVGSYSARVGARKGYAKTVIRRIKGKSTNGSTRIYFKKQRANPIYYAHLVELGTSMLPAHPYLRPAVDSSEAAVVAGLARGYSRGFQRVVNKVRSRK